MRDLMVAMVKKWVRIGYVVPIFGTIMIHFKWLRNQGLKVNQFCVSVSIRGKSKIKKQRYVFFFAFLHNGGKWKRKA